MSPVFARRNSKKTLRILNMIKPVARAFTTMDATKPVRVTVFPQTAVIIWPSPIIDAPSDASQWNREIWSRLDKHVIR